MWTTKLQFILELVLCPASFHMHIIKGKESGKMPIQFLFCAQWYNALQHFQLDECNFVDMCTNNILACWHPNEADCLSLTYKQCIGSFVNNQVNFIPCSKWPSFMEQLACMKSGTKNYLSPFAKVTMKSIFCQPDWSAKILVHGTKLNRHFTWLFSFMCIWKEAGHKTTLEPGLLEITHTLTWCSLDKLPSCCHCFMLLHRVEPAS